MDRLTDFLCTPSPDLQEAGKEEETSWISEGICEGVSVTLTQDICCKGITVSAVVAAPNLQNLKTLPLT